MNKMGFQIQILTRAAGDMVRQIWPHTLKVINTGFDAGLVHDWREKRPDGILVLRHWFPHEDLDTIDDKLNQIIALAEPVRDCRPLLEVPVNEAHQSGSDLVALNSATLKAVDRIVSAGYKPVVGSFSVGNPPNIEDDWPRFVPALRAAR
jgi:hypothetical protein